MIILPTNSVKDTGYDVDNSLRFNSASSEYLLRTYGTNHTAVKFSISFWIKRSKIGTEQVALVSYTDGDNIGLIRFNATDVLEIYDYQNAYKLRKVTNRVFRDTSAWYHIVISVDTAQGTASNRFKLYVNGVQETSFSTDTNYSQNDANMFNKNVLNWIGANPYNSGIGYTNGYMSEFCFIDGTANDEEDFGEFDEDSGIWKPISVSGLTFGTNGYYLEFKESGTGTNASGMGADTSGNTNHFAVANLTAIDQSTDTCTNNFCTFMSHTSGSYATLSEGGLISTGNSASDSGSSIASMGITNGKWYWEFEFDTQNSGYGLSGVIDTTAAKFGIQGGAVGYPVPNAYMISVGGNMSNGSSEQSGWTSDYSNGDVLGMAFDMDNGAWYMHLNGTYYDSGNPTSGGSKTGAVVSWTPNGKTLVPIVTSYNGSIEKFNFGSPPYAISSGNADGDGYGNFEYAVPSGYFALNTKNLSEYG